MGVDYYYIACIQEGVFIADWEGDPGRTTIEELAKRFSSIGGAQKAIYDARKFKPFKKAFVIEKRK